MFGFLKGGSKEPGVAYIKPLDLEIQVPKSQSVLQAALEAGVDFPHSCKVGTCTSCRCKLLSGEVKAIRDFSYVLSAEELRHGYILACQSKIKPGDRIELDVEIDHNRPHIERQDFAGVIKSSDALTHDIQRVTVELDRPMEFIAGQYAEITAPHMTDSRDYSFAAACEPSGSRQLQFYIRHTPGGTFTDWLFGESRVGEPLKVAGPMGDFWLRPADAPVLCVAGGSGLAPIKALLEAAVRSSIARDVVFLFGARTQRDLYDRDTIERLGGYWSAGFRFVPILSHEPEDSDWQGARGLVTDYITAAEAPRLGQSHAYLCGPPGMIDAALEALAGAGIDDSHIHYDKFLDASSLGGR